MDSLQALFDREIGKMSSPEEVISRLISGRLAKYHVRLSHKQLEKLKDDLKKSLDADEVTFNIDFSRGQLAKLKSFKDGQLTIDFANENIEQTLTKLTAGIQDLQLKTADEFSRSLLKKWRTSTDSVLAANRKERLQFNRRVEKQWSKALTSLDALVDLCSQMASDFNEHYRSETEANNDITFSVLKYLHARACQVGREIVVLLQNGFADGAMARWRTLHEITATAIFIAQSEKDVAERYVAHIPITDYRDTLQYQQHAGLLGLQEPSDEQIQQLKTERDRLCKIYSDSFAEDYGWASKALNKKKPTFADIEKRVKLEHVRPLYRLANQNVHAGAKGAFYRLGMPNSNTNLLIAGSSIFGLQEPGRNTAISINQITSYFLLYEPNLDRLAIVNALREMMKQTVDAFDKSGSKL